MQLLSATRSSKVPSEKAVGFRTGTAWLFAITIITWSWKQGSPSFGTVARKKGGGGTRKRAGETGKIFSPGQRGKARGLLAVAAIIGSWNAITPYRGPFHHDFVDILMSTGGTFSPAAAAARLGPGGEERRNDIEEISSPLHTNGRRRRRGATRPCGVTLIYFHRKLTGIYFAVGSPNPRAHPRAAPHPRSL